MIHSINWFEIPVTDFDRAKKFYETVLDAEIQVLKHPSLKYGIFPTDMAGGAVGGGIVQGEGFEPSMQGTLIYLNGGDDLSVPLSKIEAAGGKILMPKTSTEGNGYMAHFIDSEGNRMALHSMS